MDEKTIIPVEAYGVKMISMGLLNPGDKPLVWRGPMLHSVMQQFLRSGMLQKIEVSLLNCLHDALLIARHEMPSRDCALSQAIGQCAEDR